MIKDPIIYKDAPGDRELDLRPDGVGCIPVLGMSSYQSIRPGPEYHIHDGCMEYCLCLKGNLTFDSLGNEYPFLPGHIFVSSPRQPHHLRHNPSGLKTYRILFAIPKRGQRILNLASAESAWLVRALTHPPKRLFASSPRVRAAFERLFLLYDSEPRATNGRRVRMKSAALELLVALADAAHQQPRQKAPANIAALARRIMEKPAADYPVAAMAAEALTGKTILEALNTDLVCDAINTAMREIFLQIVYGRSQSAFSEGGLAIGASLEDLGKGLRSQVGTMFGTLEKGPRYLEMTEGYCTRVALDANDEIIGYEFVSLGKFMDFVKKGIDANEALEKAKGTYGRFAEAAKYIDPRKE